MTGGRNSGAGRADSLEQDFILAGVPGLHILQNQGEHVLILQHLEVAGVFGEGSAISEPVHGGEGVTCYGTGDEDTLAQGGCHRARLADEPGLGAILGLWKLAKG